jgi:pimeloyl-ACP methyl ester carboxylesterase
MGLASFVSAQVDRLALELLARAFVRGRPPERQAESPAQREAFERYSDPVLLQAPERFHRAPPPPEGVRERRERWPFAAPRRGHLVRLSFLSQYPAYDRGYQERFERYRENRVVHAKAYLHEHPAPAVLALHPWGAGFWRLDGEVLGARRLFAFGFDVYLMALPFHGPRTPRGTFSGGLFPAPNLRRTVEGLGQAVWDARRLRLFALARGSPRVGVLGMSLGGLVTALLAGVEPGLAFTVPMAPVVSVADLLWTQGEGRPERVAVERRGVTRDVLEKAYAPVCPLSYPLAIPRERAFILAGRGDRITPPRHVRLLWEHWQRPEVHWFAGSHLLHFGRSRAFARLDDFLRGTMRGSVPC